MNSFIPSKKIYLFFLIFLSLLLLINSKNYSESLETFAEWNITKFEIGNKRVECKTCMPAGVKISSNGTVFVSFPRWFENVTVTFAKYNSTNNIFEPWPNLTMNQKYQNNDSSGLNSILGFEIDNNDNLYILDQGKINNQPAKTGSTKLLKYSLSTGLLIKEYIFNSTIADPYSSFLNDVVISQDKNYAYISDSGKSINTTLYEIKPGIIVLDMKNKISYKILTNHFSVFPENSFWLHINNTPVKENSPMQTGVDGIALSCNGKTLFYCPLSSRMIYSISTESILEAINENNLNNLTNIKIYQEFKKEASDGLLASRKGNLYMTGIETGAIYIANEVDQDLLNFNYKNFENLKGSIMTMWPDTLAMYNGSLFFVSNQLNNFPNNINYENPKNGKYNFAIFKFDIGNDDSYIKGCSGFGDGWGIGSIIIWVLFAVIILIVLSFVLMGSNNQEEVIDKHMNLGVNKED